MEVMTNTFCASGFHLPNGSYATFGGNGAVGPGGGLGSQLEPGGYTAAYTKISMVAMQFVSQILVQIPTTSALISASGTMIPRCFLMIPRCFLCKLRGGIRQQRHWETEPLF